MDGHVNCIYKSNIIDALAYSIHLSCVKCVTGFKGVSFLGRTAPTPANLNVC